VNIEGGRDQSNVEASRSGQNDSIVPQYDLNASMFRKVVYGQGPAEDPNARLTRVKVEAARYVAEILGTFFLVFFHAGIGASAQWLLDNNVPIQGRVDSIAYSVLYGFTILALVFAFGSISGAHLNPVITFGFACRGLFTWWRVPIYILCQIAGAIIGGAFVRAFFGTAGFCGSNVPPPYSSVYYAFGTEIIGTFMFLYVVLSTSHASKIAGATAALAVGAAYTAISILAAFVSTISLNPARSLGPAIACGAGPQWNVIWAFICGPVIGSFLAIAFDRGLVSERGDFYRKRHSVKGNGGLAVVSPTVL